MISSAMRTSAIVAVIVGLGLTTAPELVSPDAGAAFAQGKSGERGNGGNRGRSNRGDESTIASRGNSGGGKSADWVPPGQASRGGDGETLRGGKSADWMPPGQAAKLGEDGETLRGAKAKDRIASVDGVETELEDTPNGRGHIASALGALNAAHANENALANASPNSRVGRIAAYRDEVLNGQAAEKELEDAQTLLDTLEAPDRTSEEVEADLRDVQRQIGDLRDQIAAAETEEEAEALRGDLRTLRSERRTLAAEYNETNTYEQAEQAVEDLTDEVESSEDLQMELLEAAANKEVTDEVVEEVNRLLGIQETEEVMSTGAVVDGTDGEGEELLLPEES